LLKGAIASAGLDVEHQALCQFPLTPRLLKPLRPDPYNSRPAVVLDALMCRLFRWNVNYHPANVVQRLRPMSAFLVLRKPGST